MYYISSDNDITSLNDDVFFIEQETKPTFASKSPERAMQNRDYHKFAERLDNVEHSHILIPDTVVTEPTPPQYRRRNSAAVKDSTRDLKARR